jgi:hypothetical protein
MWGKTIVKSAGNRKYSGCKI